MGAYSVLEHIVAHLRPSDLYALAGTCNTAYGHLKLDQPTSKANLLTKTLCTGNGMVTQSKTKTSPQALGYETFRNLSKCGGLDNGALIQSRPCSNYGINTCDEWRFHLVYHSLLENPGLDEARWWSGYIAGESTPRRLFPPKEALASSPWHASYRSQHDQGMVGVPFVDSSFAKPEPMDRMLDTDIGRQVLLQATGTLLGPPGRDNETIKLFRPMSLRRIRHRCKDCFAKAKVTKKCGCTLRKHYLDRWTCLDCSSAEEAQETQDLRLAVTAFHMVCGWCEGEIVDEPKQEEMKDEAAGEALDERPKGALHRRKSNSVPNTWITVYDVGRRFLESIYEARQKTRDELAALQGVRENLLLGVSLSDEGYDFEAT